jgi:NAD(P)-dependent dehydrogenase (short-subunit alcohol dehydrogenase family)
MMMLTRNVAFEVADKGIHVNAIAPGAIATDMNRDTFDDSEKKKQEEQDIPMRRMAQREEIAKLHYFWHHLMQLYHRYNSVCRLGINTFVII